MEDVMSISEDGGFDVEGCERWEFRDGEGCWGGREESEAKGSNDDFDDWAGGYD